MVVFCLSAHPGAGGRWWVVVIFHLADGEYILTRLIHSDSGIDHWHGWYMKISHVTKGSSWLIHGWYAQTMADERYIMIVEPWLLMVKQHQWLIHSMLNLTACLIVVDTQLTQRLNDDDGHSWWLRVVVNNGEWSANTPEVSRCGGAISYGAWSVLGSVRTLKGCSWPSLSPGGVRLLELPMANSQKLRFRASVSPCIAWSGYRTRIIAMVVKNRSFRNGIKPQQASWLLWIWCRQPTTTLAPGLLFFSLPAPMLRFNPKPNFAWF